MSYNAKSFTFWVSYYDVAQELTPKEQGEFYRAIMDYIFTGEDREPNLSKSARIGFKSVKANLKRSVANRREVGSDSDGNRDGIGTESGGNRDEVLQPENALKLKLKLNSKSIADGAGSDGGKPARLRRMEKGVCPQCGGELFRSTQTGRMTCGVCGEVPQC